MTTRDAIEEYPYEGVIYRTIAGSGDDDDQVVEIYNGVMDETMQRDNEGRVLQTAPYVVSIPLTKDDEDNYVIPRRGDVVEITRYGETLSLNVDNAEPSQLGGVSIYVTRKKWN